MKRSLVTMLILGVVNLAVPASAGASGTDDETSRTEVRSKTALPAPGVLQRSIAVAAHRAALQAQQPSTPAARSSHKGCWTGAAFMGGAAAAFTTAVVKHAQWAGSSAVTQPGAKPPSSVGVSLIIGGVLAGVGVFTLSKTCDA